MMCVFVLTSLLSRLSVRLFVLTFYFSEVLSALHLRMVNLTRNIVVLAGAKTQTGHTAPKKDPVLSKLN